MGGRGWPSPAAAAAADSASSSRLPSSMCVPSVSEGEEEREEEVEVIPGEDGGLPCVPRPSSSSGTEPARGRHSGGETRRILRMPWQRRHMFADVSMVRQ